MQKSSFLNELFYFPNSFLLLHCMQLYFIAIILPQYLDDKILAYKNFMLEKFNCKVGLKSPAHITIVPPFRMDQNKEADLLKAVKNITINFSSFSIATKNFSAFAPKTIFIDVEPNENLNHLKNLSGNYFSQHPEYLIQLDQRPFHPHITIATRDIDKKDFKEARSFFINKIFKEEWLATGLSVLKHNQKKWDVIHTSHFKNL